MDSNDDDLEKALGALNLKDDFTTSLNQLKTELKTNETCHKWVEELHSPVTDEELKLALAVYTTQFEDFSQRDFDNESDLKYSAVETVSKRCLQAQIHIMLKNFDQVSNVIAEAYHLIDDCLEKKYIGREYKDGLVYLVKTLEISCAVESLSSLGESESKNSVPLDEYLAETKKYRNLNTKNKSVVLAMKHYFLGNIRRDMHGLQIEIIKKVIEMDRENPEWHCCLYAVLKFKQDFDDYFAPPSNAMIAALTNGLESVPGPINNKDPRLRLGLISVLAELLKHNIRNFTTLKCGRYSFNDPGQLVDFIRDVADDILSVDPMSVRSNINIAKIFSSTLPFDYQDRGFARACIKRALLFHPNSSKALHRMGIFYLTNSTEQALKYFEKAFECDGRNYLSFHDLIKTYFSNIPGNRKKIDAAFDNILNSKYYESASTKGKLSEFIFYKALYKFLDSDFLGGKKNESMDLFVDAFNTCPTVKGKFKEIGRGISRYKWNTDKEILLGEIRVEFEKSFMNCTNPTRKQIYKILLDSVYEAERPRFTPGNRGGRGGGFRPDFNSRGRGNWRNDAGRGENPNPGSFHSQSRGFPSGRNFGSQSRGFNSQNGFRREESSWRGGFNNHSKNQNNWRGAGDDNGNHRQNNEKEKDGLNKFLKSQDHWTILGVVKTATRAEIKKAFFKLAQENHPDKNMDIPEQERLKKQEKMKLINKAYEALYQ